MASRKATDTVESVGYLGGCRPAWLTSHAVDLQKLPADVLRLFVSGDDESLAEDVKRRNPHVTLLDCLTNIIELARTQNGEETLGHVSPHLTISMHWLGPTARIDIPNPNSDGERWIGFVFTPDQEAGEEMTQKMIQAPYLQASFNRTVSVPWQLFLDIAQMLSAFEESAPEAAA